MPFTKPIDERVKKLPDGARASLQVARLYVSVERLMNELSRNFNFKLGLLRYNPLYGGDDLIRLFSACGSNPVPMCWAHEGLVRTNKAIMP